MFAVGTKQQAVVKRVDSGHRRKKVWRDEEVLKKVTEVIMSGSLDRLGMALNVNKLDPDYTNPGM